MPSSFPANIPIIVELMEHVDPRRALDVGPGYGKFGFLFRERVDDFRRARTLDGIDPFIDYMRQSKALDLYDNFYQGLFPTIDQVIKGDADGGRIERAYDLVMMIDVLEHYDDANGAEALAHALTLAPHVLISTPLNYPQGPSHGNPYETHRSEWPAERLRQFGRFDDRSHRAAPDCVVGMLSRGAGRQELFNMKP